VQTVGLGSTPRIGRTVTEADITNFVNCTGMVEVLFTNLDFLAHESDIKQRLAPAAVFAGDTIYAECEVVEARRSKIRPDRSLLRTEIRVVKQGGTVALTYMPLRMVKSREFGA
jgi:acyl dehydratase